MKYTHLTQEQRYTISVLLQGEEPMTPTAIARIIGVHKSTVSREVRRNCDMRGHHKYDCELAQRTADKRMKDRPHTVRFTDEMKQESRKMIVGMDYSPEQVVGRSRLEGKARSHPTTPSTRSAATELKGTVPSNSCRLHSKITRFI